MQGSFPCTITSMLLNGCRACTSTHLTARTTSVQESFPCTLASMLLNGRRACTSARLAALTAIRQGLFPCLIVARLLAKLLVVRRVCTSSHLTEMTAIVRGSFSLHDYSMEDDRAGKKSLHACHPDHIASILFIPTTSLGPSRSSIIAARSLTMTGLSSIMRR